MENDPTRTDRRGALQCLGWAGTGALFAFSGGIASATTLEHALGGYQHSTPGKYSGAGAFSFVQISDTHIGFSKPANPDTAATL